MLETTMRRLSLQAHRLSASRAVFPHPARPISAPQWEEHQRAIALASSIRDEERQARPVGAAPPCLARRRFGTAAGGEADPDAGLVDFRDLPGIDPRSLSGLDKMGLSKMTEIQRKAYVPIAVGGKDVLARAQTGTGKTLAFLVPTIQRLLEIGVQENKVQVLILSPTRELALQIDSQVEALTADHDEITHQTLHGGVPKVADINAMRRRVPSVLVATPGRLCDHLRSTRVGGTSFRALVSEIDVMILDEADRYVDMGSDISAILRAVPKARQTLLFSATLPDAVLTFLHGSMRPDFERVDTIVGDGDQTAKIVQQSHVILPKNKMVTGAVEIVRQIMDIPESKVLVFFPTTSMVAFFSKIFNFGLGGKYVLEIHSKKTQAYRTSVSNRFRELKGGAMFTSDVSARGVDYPGVTHVIQVSLPASQESYIHRLGRTGRAGSAGQAILILAEAERGFLEKLSDGIDVPVNEVLQSLVNGEKKSRVGRALDPVMQSIAEGTNETLVSAAEETYRSLLGYYNGKLGSIGAKGMESLVEFCNAWAAEAGLQATPTISASMAQACGLDKVPGIVLARKERSTRSRARRKEKTAGYHGDDRLIGTGDYERWDKNVSIADAQRSMKAAFKKNLRKTSKPSSTGWFD